MACAQTVVLYSDYKYRDWLEPRLCRSCNIHAKSFAAKISTWKSLITEILHHVANEELDTNDFSIPGNCLNIRVGITLALGGYTLYYQERLLHALA